MRTEKLNLSELFLLASSLLQKYINCMGLIESVSSYNYSLITNLQKIRLQIVWTKFLGGEE